MNAEILIIDDEEDICNLVQGILEDEGYTTRKAMKAETAYAQVQEKSPDLVVLDIWLQGSADDGMKVLEKIKDGKPHLPVVMISGHGTIETAVEAIKKGAYDFIEKPFKADRLLLMIQRALENSNLRKENETLKKKTTAITEEIVGNSPTIQNIRHIIKKAAPTNSRVLITGEAGTGKNLAAHYIHRFSNRADKPFMVLNCTTMHPERLEAELFGTVDGIFGEPSKSGILELANGGTLLLDEIVDIPLDIQGKIIRMLQENNYQRVGSPIYHNIDIRMIATTSKNIQKSIEEGQFRRDLYYRLNVVPIHMPNLSERYSDIPILIDTLMNKLSEEHGSLPRKLSDTALIAIQAYNWPGNIRQLRNVLEWMIIMESNNVDKEFLIEHLPPEITNDNASHEKGTNLGTNSFMTLTLREAREKFEKDYLRVQVERFHGNISQTAQFIGMERSALHRKLKSLDICANEKDNTVPEQNNKRKAISN